MQDSYSNFLDTRAAQRRLAAKFSRPRWLLLNTLVFVTTMTAIWTYGMVWGLWFYSENFALPVLVGLGWSLLLAVQALVHYRRSAARVERRELAVEDEMRQFIEKNGGLVDDESLFAMHRSLEADLEQQGRWSLALTAFAFVNALSWIISALDMGTSWGFQMTLPLAALVIGAVHAYASWQRQNQLGRAGWFTRLPLRHILAYTVGVIGLGLAGGYHLINSWDADTLIKGWFVVLMLHILWAVALRPLLQRLAPGARESEQPAKRKPSARLLLTDDGEVVEAADEEAAQYQTRRL